MVPLTTLFVRWSMTVNPWGFTSTGASWRTKVRSKIRPSESSGPLESRSPRCVSHQGCRTSPVGYLEGIYVMPGVRRSGAARALAAAAAEWSRSLGCTEMGSDRAIDNTVSGAFHEAVGFEEVSTIVCYRKDLDR